MRVKVCGITSLEDALSAAGEGVDALGFNFYPSSPRYIDPMAAREIISRMLPFVAAVGLFVNVSEPVEVARLAREAGVQTLQLHGDETPDYCHKLAGWPLIKALRVDGRLSSVDFERYPVSAFLLDAHDEGLWGGTGRAFDWSLATEIRGVRPIILAGGLKPENVAQAIRIVRPYAVDVCTGVEASPGRKDKARLRAFMSEVRHASKNL
jgi:phosphoribosylanthranilate isomerase